MIPILFGDRLLILCDEMSEKVGSIIMPKQHSERSRTATVVAAGPGSRRNDGSIVPMAYHVGDRVLLSWYTGVHAHLPGQEFFGVPVDEDRHRFVREEEILAKLSD